VGSGRRKPQLLSFTRRAILAAVIVGGTSCRAEPRSTMAAYAWEVMGGGTTLSVAAWAKDSAALRTAAQQVRDSMRSVDPRGNREILRRAWIAEREDLRLQPDWYDVADGYALDRAVPALAAVADSALLDLGGLFLWIGPETKRTVGIADPDNSLDAVAHVEWRGGSLATVTGQHRSVTVLASGAFKAASWASALFSLGCGRALALAPRLERRRISVVCADSAGVRWTTDLQNRVVLATARAP
jgi:hypothetical protein